MTIKAIYLEILKSSQIKMGLKNHNETHNTYDDLIQFWPSFNKKQWFISDPDATASFQAKNPSLSNMKLNPERTHKT